MEFMRPLDLPQNSVVFPGHFIPQSEAGARPALAARLLPQSG